MTDISILPQPVREIIERTDSRFTSGNSVPVERAHLRAPEYQFIRTELLRVSAENVHVHGAVTAMQSRLFVLNKRAEQAEAELERVRARIESAPTVTLRALVNGQVLWPVDGAFDPDRRVRLVADDAKEG